MGRLYIIIIFYLSIYFYGLVRYTLAPNWETERNRNVQAMVDPTNLVYSPMLNHQYS